MNVRRNNYSNVKKRKEGVFRNKRIQMKMMEIITTGSACISPPSDHYHHRNLREKELFFLQSLRAFLPLAEEHAHEPSMKALAILNKLTLTLLPCKALKKSGLRFHLNR
jgi:hypothetical protein